MSALVAQLGTQLALPLSSALILMALALVLLVLRRGRAAALVLSAALVGLWLASTTALAERLLATLEQVHPAPALAMLAPADAILVLGGGTRPALPPREYPELAEAGDRVLHAARLFHARKAPIVLVSGGRPAPQTSTSDWVEAEDMSALLQELGVGPESIVRENQSTNTHENCLFAKPLLEARGAHDVLLVTSAAHMPRAFATCRTAGLAVRAAPTDFQLAGAEPRTVSALAPNLDALLWTHLALRERVGFWVYRRRGWITP